jgi:hypothetical protein
MPESWHIPSGDQPGKSYAQQNRHQNTLGGAHYRSRPSYGYLDFRWIGTFPGCSTARAGRKIQANN